MGYTAGTRAALLAILLALVLCQPTNAQERRTFTVPFHSVSGFVLLDTTLNGKPAALLLDTGAPISFTLDGDGIELRAKGFRTTSSVGVAYYKPPIKFDGVIGEDILRKFSAVRIDYKAQTVTLER